MIDLGLLARTRARLNTRGGRDGVRPAPRAFLGGSISAPCGCGGGAKCAELVQGASSAKAHRKRVRRAAKTAGQGGRGSRPQLSRSGGLWPVLSDTAPVRAIAPCKQRTNKRRGDDEQNAETMREEGYLQFLFSKRKAARRSPPSSLLNGTHASCTPISVNAQ